MCHVLQGLTFICVFVCMCFLYVCVFVSWNKALNFKVMVLPIFLQINSMRNFVLHWYFISRENVDLFVTVEEYAADVHILVCRFSFCIFLQNSDGHFGAFLCPHSVHHSKLSDQPRGLITQWWHCCLGSHSAKGLRTRQTLLIKMKNHIV